MDYRELCLLWAARETGIIETVMFDAGTIEEIAEQTGVTERAARITLEAMVEMGFLERLDEEYEATNRALGLFAKTDVRSIGSVPHQMDCLVRWFELPETMRTGSPPETPENWTSNYMGAMATVDESTIRSCVTEAVHEHPDAERVLDVGGGPGVFAKEFARRGFEVTLLDKPDVIDIASRFLEREPIELVSEDVIDALPTGYDLLFCSRVAHALGPNENRTLIENSFDALEPGGAAVLIDRIRGRSEGAAVMGAHMLAQTDNGDTYTANQFEDWFARAGFANVEIRGVPGTNQQAIVGHRPRN
ncbi:methyltransferase [Haladaptatus pallidirubidus]|uniref:O-methyltransferase C-terminal domain-containing protein n=1 Tax=Haladaptatus pallidirubidus TaxID=1008152 RepID=A0AAV3ULV4_9EURY|nr:methyltransferase [Haladaptatus pallidirubidus]